MRLLLTLKTMTSWMTRKEKISEPLIKATKHIFVLQSTAISIYEVSTILDFNTKNNIRCSQEHHVSEKKNINQ